MYVSGAPAMAVGTWVGGQEGRVCVNVRWLWLCVFGVVVTLCYVSVMSPVWHSEIFCLIASP